MNEREKRAEILVQGTVQAVGFRPFIYRTAEELGLSGTVKNLGDAGVEIEIEGSESSIQNFLEKIREENPPLSRIRSIDVKYSKPKGLETFQILESEKKQTEKGGTIPADAAICEKCLSDMRNPDSRYHGYWATSCVDCGPRFTIIESLPYDRPRTSMKEFPMCEDCRNEYENPLDRRYHAQTIACPDCGPELISHPRTENPIPEAGKRLREGKTVAIKGIGGTHLACNAFDDEAVNHLKEKLQRPHQPLAIMAKNLEMIKEIANFNGDERNSLRSVKRPIVILNQIEDSKLSEEVSEGLHNVGVMLPYTGLHFLLFEQLEFPLVMTSANMPGQPMLTENEKIISKLGDTADFMLLHEREIVARCDDSVIRYSGGERKFIRRSRGWAPSPIKLDYEGEPVLALGAELDNTIAISDGENCYVSQYIGDVDNLETLKFLENTIEHLTSITSLEIPEKVACDLHPKFLTTELAHEMAENPVQIQHHHAHLAGVLGEKGLKETIGISVDGVGYGTDGTVWGGEILHSTRTDFERLGHLSKMLMPGGDRATKYPSRIIAGILHESSSLSDILKKHASFPGGDEEQRAVEHQLKSGYNSPETTSTGRFLDAVSSLLGVCYERSYEGEPAMKLESFSIKGSPLEVEPNTYAKDGKTLLDVQELFKELVELKEKGKNKRDIGATAENCLAEGLARIATEKAEERNVRNVALTGGVAYNDRISKKIREVVEDAGLELTTNRKVPCGDGGTSFGQVIAATSPQ